MTPLAGGTQITLDPTFDYEPFIPKKKAKRFQTIRGSFTQRSFQRFTYNTDGISWKMTTTSGHAKVIMSLYNTEDPRFYFTGAYGETLTVDFSEVKAKDLGGVWELEGTFIVICDTYVSGQPSFNPNHKCEVTDDPNRMNTGKCKGTEPSA
tara:strand:- start:26196 stop:26648 length:453 start_codon:yes stop_codon:yes gene_type:complete